MKQEYLLDVNQIQEFLPHRPPFVMIDRIVEIRHVGDPKTMSGGDKVGTRVRALKAVSFNEPQFMGHFPKFSLMPGVLTLESIAQTAGFSVYPWFAADPVRLKHGVTCQLIGVDGLRYKKPITPGCIMEIETEVFRIRGNFWSFKAQVVVEGNVTTRVEEVFAHLTYNGEKET